MSQEEWFCRDRGGEMFGAILFVVLTAGFLFMFIRGTATPPFLCCVLAPFPTPTFSSVSEKWASIS